MFLNAFKHAVSRLVQVGANSNVLASYTYGDSNERLIADEAGYRPYYTRHSTIVTWQETDDGGGVMVKTEMHVNKEVYLMNADGSNQVRLINSLPNDNSPAWSSDGMKIVFRSDRERDCCDPTEQVWIMNADGSNQFDLSNNGFDDYCPDWSR